MPRIIYVPRKFSESSLALIGHADTIVREYVRAGFRLTLRQLYYQFVARGIIPNSIREYKRLGSVINDARLAGLLDWSAIEDRGRNLIAFPGHGSPQEVLNACAAAFEYDPWESQPHYVEVWVEKEALVGVIAVPCEKWRVPHFACKGYTSQSEMWSAGHYRFREKIVEGKDVTVIHLGDHDPSGIDMTRDIDDRLAMFAEGPVEVVRIALNLDQVEQYKPPPNPAKTTDSRSADYIDKYGYESWELYALEPKVIAKLIETEIEERLDVERWESSMGDENEVRRKLGLIAERYDELVEQFDV